MKHLMKGNTMNSNKFTGSLSEWIKVVRAELRVEVERVRKLPEFQGWAAQTIAANIEQPNIPQWNIEDCEALWIIRGETCEFTRPPIDAPKWATSEIIRPEGWDGTNWSVKYSATIDGAEICETFAIDETGTITYHDTLLTVETDPAQGEEEVIVEIGQVDKLITVLTAVQRVIGGHLRTGEQMRDEADELYRRSYLVDAEQGNPVAPDESDTFTAKHDEDSHDRHAFRAGKGHASVYLWHNTGASPDLSATVETSNMEPGDVTSIVRALRAAEHFHGIVSANLRPTT